MEHEGPQDPEDRARKRTKALLIAGAVLIGLTLAAIEVVHTPAPTMPLDTADHEDPAAVPQLQPRIENPQGTPPVQPEIDASGPRLQVRGRVLRASFEPAAEMRVEARLGGETRLEGRTDDAGAFVLALQDRPVVPATWRLVASGLDAAAGRSITLDAHSPAIVDIGTLVLAAAHALDIEVRFANEPVPNAQVEVATCAMAEAHLRRLGSGTPWIGTDARAQTNDRGVARFKQVQAGLVRALVRGQVTNAEGASRPAYGQARFVFPPKDGETSAPQEPSRVQVDLELARDVRVEVVDTASQEPVPGIWVRAVRNTGRHHEVITPDATLPRTNARGIAILHNLPEGNFDLQLGGPDWMSLFGAVDDAKLARGQTAIRLEVNEPTTIAFPVEVRDGELPEDGTRVTLEQPTDWGLWPGTRTTEPRHAWIREGRLEIATWSPKTWLMTRAVLPDGRTGLAVSRPPHGTGGANPPAPVVFTHARTLTVKAVERGTGKPAPDIAVVVSPERATSAGFLPVRTNVAGIAELEGLPAEVCLVALAQNPDWVEPHRQGVFGVQATVDLTEGDQTVVYEVEPAVEVEVHVTSTPGPRLPPGLDARFILAPQSIDGHRPSTLEMDATRGLLRTRLRPPIAAPKPPLRRWSTTSPQTVHVVLSAPGHATEVVTLARDAGTGRLIGRAHLGRAYTLRVHTLINEGDHFATHLQRLDRDGSWVRAGSPRVPLSRESMDVYEALPAGSYRMQEWFLGGKTGRVSDVIELGGDGAQETEATLLWDLRDQNYMEGEVRLPAGVDPKGLTIFALHHETMAVLPGAVCNGLRFKLRLTTDDPIRLVPVHPACVPDPEQGEVVMTGPQSGIELRMVLRD